MNDARYSSLQADVDAGRDGSVQRCAHFIEKIRSDDESSSYGGFEVYLELESCTGGESNTALDSGLDSRDDLKM